MKKFIFIIFCLFVSTLFQSTQIFANTQISDGNKVSQFDLLESYLTEHKEKIILFQDRYNITDNQELDILLLEIDDLKNVSKKIKNNTSDGYNKTEISAYIIKRIKFINEELKIILTKEKKNYQLKLDKKIKTYNKLGLQVGNYLINIIEKLANTVTQSDISVEKKLKIVIHLKNLQKNANALKNFGDNNYITEEKLQEDFVLILKEIKSDMGNIKKILKN